MKPIALQLITVKLENGQQGIFVGTPLIQEPHGLEGTQTQVSEIWFSDVRGLPDKMPLNELIELVKSQLRQCKETMH